MCSTKLRTVVTLQPRGSNGFSRDEPSAAGEAPSNCTNGKLLWHYLDTSQRLAYTANRFHIQLYIPCTHYTSTIFFGAYFPQKGNPDEMKGYVCTRRICLSLLSIWVKAWSGSVAPFITVHRMNRVRWSRTFFRSFGQF